MFQKIKNKILPINKKSGLIILGVLLFVSFFPSIFAEAAIPDFINHAINKLNAVYGPIVAAFLFAFYLVGIGSAMLWITTTLLQWVIDITPEATSILSGETAHIVQAGWNLTSGIANMALILVFVFIALSTILGVEKYHLQKLFPRLIAVALLINFTLLFVAMGVDVSNFLFHSIASKITSADGGSNIIWSAIDPIFDLTDKIWGAVIAYIVAQLVALIPFAAVAKLVANIVAAIFIIPLTIQNLYIGIVTIMLSLLMGLFFLILLARIFVIQILAIIAPLAFLCLIFEDTQKHFKLWLETLVQWLFVSVIFIFLLYVGLAMMPFIAALSESLNFQDAHVFVRWFGPHLIPPIIMIVYFMVIAGLMKKFTPVLASSAISGAKGAFKTISPYTKAVTAGFKSGSKESLENTKKDPMVRKGADWAQSAGQTMTSSDQNRFTRGLGKGLGAFSMWVNRSGDSRDQEKVNNAAEDLKGTPSDYKITHYVSTDSIHKKLATILAAEKDGQTSKMMKKIDARISKDFAKIKAEADKLGMGDKVANALPVEHIMNLKQGDSSLDLSHNSSTIKNFINKGLGEKGIEKVSNQILAGLKSENFVKAASSESLYTAIIKDPDVKNLKAFAKGGGKEAVERLREDIRKAGSLNNLNPEAEKNLKRTAGGRLLLHEISKPTTPPPSS